MAVHSRFGYVSSICLGCVACRNIILQYYPFLRYVSASSIGHEIAPEAVEMLRAEFRREYADDVVDGWLVMDHWVKIIRYSQ